MHLQHIFNNRRRIIIAVNALPISPDCPHWSFTKYVPALSQSSRAIRFQLITNRLTGRSLGGHHHMNVIASNVFRPQMLTSMLTMPLDLTRHNDSHVSIKHDDGMLQPILPPSLEQGLWKLRPLLASTPSLLVSLQMGAVHRPSYEIGKRFVIMVHEMSTWSAAEVDETGR